MKSTFSEWYPLDEEELQRIWEEALFVPDTNILLHCLRHSESIRTDLLHIFERLQTSLWVPYQVGLEFHRKFRDVDVTATRGHEELCKELDKVATQLTERLRNIKAHPYMDSARELANLEEFVAGVKQRLTADAASYPADSVNHTVERLSGLLEGRLGEPLSKEDLKVLHKDGEQRYAQRIPPGYKDDTKKPEEGDKYGDLIIWEEMIRKARALQKPVIFITDDAKEDWWRKHHGKRLGPRPELRAEFLQKTGQLFHMYDLPRFLEFAAQRDEDIEESTVHEIATSVEWATLADYDVELATAGETRLEYLLAVANSDSVDPSLRTRALERLEAEKNTLLAVLAGVPIPSSSFVDDIDKQVARARLQIINAALPMPAGGLFTLGRDYPGNKPRE